MAEPETLIRIVAPHFTAGAAVIGGRLMRCAPIIRYMHLWTVAEALRYCEKKGWELAELASDPPDEVEES